MNTREGEVSALLGTQKEQNVAILLCGANVVVWCYALRSQNADHRGAICAHSLTIL